MSVVVKKRVIISAEQQNAQVGAFFRESGFELTDVFDPKLLSEYVFIVDDYLPELKVLPRIQTQKKIDPACLPEVRASVDMAEISHPLVKKLMSSYFNDAQNFDLIDRYSKDFKTVYSLKIHDYLNVGYFVDTIVVEAYKNKFDFEEVRSYLNFALPYALKQLEKDQNFAPLDVTFSYSEDGFAIQIALNAGVFDLKKDFNSKSLVLGEFSGKTNYFDASYFVKRERLMLSSLWFKDEKLKHFKSFFFTEISGRSNTSNGSSLINMLDEPESATQYTAKTPVVNDDEWGDSRLTRKKARDVEESVTRLKGTPDEAEVSTIVKGSGPDEKEATTTVKGSGPDEKEATTTIKGSGPDEKVSSTIIKGSGPTEANDDEWKIKSSGATESAKEEIIRLKSLGQELTEEKTPVLRVLSDDNKDKLESQVIRMKKVIEQMKTEIVKLRATADEPKELSSESGLSTEQMAEMLESKKELSKAIESMKNKEKLFLKQKVDFEQILAAKDKKIEALQLRVEEAKSEFARSSALANEEKVEELQLENKALLARMELANKKINVMSDNKDKHETDSGIKKDREINSLKTNLGMAQALIDKFKQERSDLEGKLADEREKFSRFREEKEAAASSSKDQLEKDKQFITISSEKKILEEKFRAQNIELKKQEQKLKFTVAQLEESQRKKTLQPAQAAAKSNDAYIKQLENANARIAEASSDLMEKKKEIIKLKQDSNVLAAKVADLEKKLANIDKKAA